VQGHISLITQTEVTRVVYHPQVVLIDHLLIQCSKAIEENSEMSSGPDIFDSILQDDAGTQGEVLEGMDERIDEKVSQIVNES
jgi:hypothetical protein